MSYVARRKRVVKLPDREIDLGDFNLTDFVTPNSLASKEVADRAWQRVMNYYRSNPQDFIRLYQTIGLYNMYVKELWNVVNVEVKYRPDDPVFNVPDWWELPNESWKMKQADCEGTTFLLTSAICTVKRGWEVNDSVAKDSVEYGCIGFYRDVNGIMYGHGFVIRKTPTIKLWLWVETTSESEVQQAIWYAWNPDQLIPVYFFTDRDAYRIDKDYAVLGLAQDYVSKCRQWIDLMIQYVEAGKWLPVKWVHKRVRPVKPSALIIV